ncbi:hypothetical protein GY45DRAFT_1034577 [Cubamyces sp. BRFM 1775]|nr:hypothetical protein GY45DRAFT_1034577 [Cubamyces sp. BRFM 1775]
MPIDRRTQGYNSRYLLPEVIDCILRLARVDSDDKDCASAILQSCALISCDWLHPSREHLYREVQLTKTPSPRARLLSRALHFDPDLGRFIRTLCVNTDFLFTRSCTAASEDSDFVGIPACMPVPFHLMPELRNPQAMPR